MYLPGDISVRVELRIGFEPWVVDPCYAFVLLKELSHFLRVGTMLPHTKVQCLKSEIQEE